MEAATDFVAPSGREAANLEGGIAPQRIPTTETFNVVYIYAPIKRRASLNIAILNFDKYLLRSSEYAVWRKDNLITKHRCLVYAPILLTFLLNLGVSKWKGERLKAWGGIFCSQSEESIQPLLRRRKRQASALNTKSTLTFTQGPGKYQFPCTSGNEWHIYVLHAIYFVNACTFLWQSKIFASEIYSPARRSIIYATRKNWNEVRIKKNVGVPLSTRKKICHNL